MFGVEVKKGIHLGPVVQPRDDKSGRGVLDLANYVVKVRKKHTPGSRGSHFVKTSCDRQATG